MADDKPDPLCSPSDLTAGAFADLTRAFDPGDLEAICEEATRACESEVSRRFAPFTITESLRADAVDPDELGALSSGIPLDLNAALGASYASALGGSVGSLVRRLWLSEFAPLYTELWAYSNVSLQATLSIGGTQPIHVLRGPMPDSGMVWLNLGTFLPQGSLVEVTYSGGYQTYPADLRRAGKYMAASICCRELDPTMTGPHNADSLEDLACRRLQPYRRT